MQILDSGWGSQRLAMFLKMQLNAKYMCVREILPLFLEIPRHQSLFQQIQWIWQEELLYTMILLLLKINWASFSPDGFSGDNYRIAYTFS